MLLARGSRLQEEQEEQRLMITMRESEWEHQAVSSDLDGSCSTFLLSTILLTIRGSLFAIFMMISSNYLTLVFLTPSKNSGHVASVSLLGPSSRICHPLLFSGHDKRRVPNEISEPIGASTMAETSSTHEEPFTRSISVGKCGTRIFYQGPSKT